MLQSVIWRMTCSGGEFNQSTQYDITACNCTTVAVRVSVNIYVCIDVKGANLYQIYSHRYILNYY